MPQAPLGRPPPTPEEAPPPPPYLQGARGRWDRPRARVATTRLGQARSLGMRHLRGAAEAQHRSRFLRCDSSRESRTKVGALRPRSTAPQGRKAGEKHSYGATTYRNGARSASSCNPGAAMPSTIPSVTCCLLATRCFQWASLFSSDSSEHELGHRCCICSPRKKIGLVRDNGHSATYVRH
jgi:hypothetical protein